MSAEPRTGLGGHRLARQQRRLWRLGPPSAAWCSRIEATVEGPLDGDRLREALEAVAAADPALRTLFHRPPGLKTPFQIVAERLEPGWFEVDESPPPAAFDPAAGPPLRLAVGASAGGRHRLWLELSALCGDRTSAALALGRLASAYGGGEPAPGGEEAPVEVVDYADWQHDLLAGSEAADGEEFWRHRPGPAAAAPLPMTRPGAPSSPFEPAAVVRRLDPGAFEALAAAAAAAETTAPRLVEAAWHVVTAAAGGGEPVIGSLHPGRDFAELTAALGPFARYLPRRVPLPPAARLGEVAGRLAREDEAAAEWAEFFDPGERDDDGGFALAFEWHELPPPVTAAGVRFSAQAASGCCDRFDLRLAACRGGAGLGLETAYDPARCDRADVERIADHLSAALDLLAAHPEATVAELVQPPAAERRRLALDFQPAPRPPAAAADCVHRRFAACARRHPDRTALVCEPERWSYGELAARAGTIARRLRRRGVGPECVVGLALDRSAQAIAALLGILEAGGAYLPLDPAQPPERLAAMVEEARPVLVIADRARAGAFESAGVPVLDPGAESDGEAAERAGAADADGPATDPRSLAYVLFTSGSTGRPKAVAVEHAQIAAYAAAVGERLGLPEDASFATVTTLAADLGNTAIFPALTRGGCLHVLSEERIARPAALADYLRRERVDALKIVPGHLAALVAGGDPAELLPRAALVLGGEGCEREWAERLAAAAPGLALFNHYGPTEATVGCLVHRLGEVPADPRVRGLPLGRPLAGSRVYVLDRGLRPVPTWAPGEIFIGGAGVARGYLGRPRWTAERFVPDPFAAETGGRLYRTGDRARHLPAAGLEFLGRVDDQLKVRGFRIEPGEIEAALASHPAVRRAYATLHRGAGGRERLVAYWVAAGGGTAEAAELREHARRRLPDYMLPSALVAVAELPLNANGKVDRARLPDPDQAAAPRRYVAPRDATEELLAALWARVLGHQRVGVEDNFFDLGGDSILSIRIVAEAGREGLALEPMQLFEAQTVAELAACARRRDGGPAAALDGAESDGAAAADGEAPAPDLETPGLDAAELDRIEAMVDEADRGGAA